MKIIKLVFVLSFFAFSCQTENGEEGQKIVLRNTSSVSLSAKAVTIDRAQIEVPDGEFYPVLVADSGDTLASQTDDTDRDGQWDELFFVATFDGVDSLSYALHWSKIRPEYPMKTSVRFGKRSSADSPVEPKTSDTLYADQIHAKLGYQPYQTDGPSWENDKVGFRHYFDGRNAKDLFGKKVAEMSPENVGINAEGAVEDNYHVMEDWGRDVLAVGNSAGLGGIEMMIGDRIYRIGNISGDTVTNFDNAVFQIVEEGPVRSIIQFTYNNWHPVEGRSYTVKERVSIWPGMYAYRNSVTVDGMQGDETLLVGLVNSNTEEPITELAANDNYVVLYTHDQQTYDKTWWLGMGLILPKEKYTGHGEAPQTGQFATSFYGKLDLDEQPVSYYAVGTWELSDENFADSTYFVNYIKDLADQLAVDVEIEVR